MNTRVALLLGALVAAAPPLAAQEFRFRSTTTGQYVQLRPVVYDSATNTFLSAPLAYAAPVISDLEISAWGLGIQGLRGYALLRGRGAFGSELVWPRSDDHFDALYAYLELERPSWRVRAGRQQRFSGLGFYAFDGLTATVRPASTMRIEAYGGRGLARGFLEPISSPELKALDPLTPEQGTILLGASLWAAPTPQSSFTAVYQRELLSDRSGLASERAALDAQVGFGPKLYLTGSADADLAADAFGKMRASAVWRLPRSGYVEVEVFRYRPVFDLTTIWGVFSPEGHSGAGASVNFAAAQSIGVSAGLDYRHYSTPASATPFLIGVGDNTTEFNAGARWRRGRMTAEGTYTLTTGYGGGESGGNASLSLTGAAGWRLGLNGTAFQQVDEFRVSSGTVYGAGFQARTQLGGRASLRAELNRYWQDRSQGADGIDWSQTRALVALDWTFGANADRTRLPAVP